MLQHHQPNSPSFGSFQDLLYRRLLHLLRRHIHLPPLQCHNTDRQLVQTTHLLLQYLRCVLDRGYAVPRLRHFTSLRERQVHYYRGKVWLHQCPSARPSTQLEETLNQNIKQDHVAFLQADSMVMKELLGIQSSWPLWSYLDILSSAPH